MSILATVLLAAGALPAHGELPSGWRPPNARELADPMLQQSPNKFTRAIADFNADGRQDTALLLIRRKSGDEALWVHLSDRDGGYHWIKLDHIKGSASHPDASLAMAIDVEPPGVVAYACFDYAEDCNFGPDSGRPKLKLSSPSLMYFRPESAASLYFWSNSKQKFLRVWLSD
ncbi:hypothetical protein [Lysobacter sp. Root983]|uniref:hypothetical protein n=1 Tax=Lysobacter sp. Root983 TaxID=1736613 RepID=UPI0012FC378D|nr:hypothetical protein [Lysobacter sp. Root983]